jgi:hypothetical protein
VRLWGVPPPQLLHQLLRDPALWAGSAFALACEAARLILRWRLRARVGRG